MEPPSDAEVIAASLADPRAFAEVYDRHAEALLRYLVHRVGRGEGESLLGEVFRIAFESRGRYDTTRPDARPWLYGIAANLVMKHLRATGRRRGALRRLGQRRQATPAPFEDEIVDTAATRQLWGHVAVAVDELAERDREVLFLYAWEDLSYVEIAEALDIPVGTVRSRLNRVRRRLRELQDLSGEVVDEPSPRAKGTAGR